MKIVAALVSVCLAWSAARADPLEEALVVRSRGEDGDALALRSLLGRPAEHRAQALVRVVEQDGRVRETLSYRADAEYVCPASAIKLPGAIAALAALRRVPGAEVDTPLEFDALPPFDPAHRVDASLPGGRVTLRGLLRKALVVSDNEAFNRFFELAGHQAANETLWAMGLSSARIAHRLSAPRSTDESRATPAVHAPTLGAVWPARVSTLRLPPHAQTAWLFGRAHIDPLSNARVEAPMDFAERNGMSLDDQQRLLAWVVRPDVALGVRAPAGWHDDDRALVRQVLGENAATLQGAAFADPKHTEARYRPALSGALRVRPREALEVRSKAGKAYGFVLDNAYYRDTRSGRAVFVTVVAFSNRDGVMNDGRYDYADVVEPFVRAVGEVAARRAFDAP